MATFGTPKTQSTGNRQAVIIRHLKEALRNVIILLNQDACETRNDGGPSALLIEAHKLALKALQEAE